MELADFFVIIKTFKNWPICFSLQLQVQAHNQEFFRAGEVFQNKGTSMNSLSTTQERKAQQRKISEIFFLDTLKTTF